MPGKLRGWRGCASIGLSVAVRCTSLSWRGIPTWHRRPIGDLATWLLHSHTHWHLQWHLQL